MVRSESRRVGLRAVERESMRLKARLGLTRILRAALASGERRLGLALGLSLILAATISLASRVAGAGECKDCHYPGNTVKAPAVAGMENSAHGKMNCRDCHPGDDMPPCPPALPAAGCALCHQDEVSALGNSSHGKKVQAYLKTKNASLKLQDVCAAWVVGLVRNLYIVLILVTVGGMFTHNMIDLYFKSAKGEPYQRADALAPRFTVNERIQHAALALSFLILAYSGFALRFSDSFYAQPFLWIPGGTEVRHWMHRGAAALFVVLAGYHLLYLALAERGRAQLSLILPRPRDLRELKEVAFRYLGWKHEPLELSHYTYVEKAEYWALIWGGMIMTATGGVLLLTDQVLAIVPLWVVDLAGTIHFYEAVLAVSAIMVWHAYWVIFDPEYYPLNLTWLYGWPRRQARAKTAPESEESK